MPELGIVSPSTVFRQITVPPGLAEVIATHKALFGGFVMEANDGGAEGNADGGDSARTFTQAELNDIVGRRVAAERNKFGDYDALKAKARFVL